MDDTLIRLGEPWVEYLNEKYGTQVNWQEVDDWDISKFFPEIKKYQVFEPLHSAELWKRTKPLEGAVENIEKLRADGHQIVVVTSAPPKTVAAKLIYSLFRYFKFTYKDVVIAYNKQSVQGDILIDDAPHNLAGGSYMKILMDAPHNRDYNAEWNGMMRVETWDQIYDLITELAITLEQLEQEDL